MRNYGHSHRPQYNTHRETNTTGYDFTIFYKEKECIWRYKASIPSLLLWLNCNRANSRCEREMSIGWSAESTLRGIAIDGEGRKIAMNAANRRFSVNIERGWLLQGKINTPNTRLHAVVSLWEKRSREKDAANIRREGAESVELGMDDRNAASGCGKCKLAVDVGDRNAADFRIQKEVRVTG